MPEPVEKLKIVEDRSVIQRIADNDYYQQLYSMGKKQLIAFYNTEFREKYEDVLPVSIKDRKTYIISNIAQAAYNVTKNRLKQKES